MLPFIMLKIQCSNALSYHILGNKPIVNWYGYIITPHYYISIVLDSKV